MWIHSSVNPDQQKPAHLGLHCFQKWFKILLSVFAHTVYWTNTVGFETGSRQQNPISQPLFSCYVSRNAQN